ncbi:His-Xaa-Ser system radical SAM maturase HxsC [Xanthomonas campestris]|uniref:His-Xaa-Ser system radical SAM maturase HxsC n=1 Tax=Xanthomonas campestris pv. papavericola TaxID=487881 RepID=A0AAJ3CF68_XANCA|nr:His-Xaa-Ser system radical SAM maturase HxsC [Xanthomonas campestris]MEC3888875.1 His-Xaa-Ser system radical SAM maturase HxsC [Xanthomonas campestris pv. papavericola]
MLPLETKALLGPSTRASLLKVVGLADFSQSPLPLERMALDIRGLDLHRLSESLLGLPWGAVLAPEEAVWFDDLPLVRLKGSPDLCKPGDVIELNPLQSKVAIRYRRGDTGNVLFATERCNSYCLMCSQPPREVEDAWRVQHLLDLIDLIDPNEPSLAISGGEPTLLGDGLVQVTQKCADALPNTHIHILSNGRLRDPALPAKFAGIHPNLSWGVPLYGDHHALHDYVVQSEGAFAQTLRGLYALEAAGQRVEIRVVLVKPSFERLAQLARYIWRNLPFVEHVALMGIEPIGFAKAHQQELWADPADYAKELAEAVETLAEGGIAVSLYNLPLCTLDRSLWPYAVQSISTWKNDYLPACNACSVRERCGGFFSWITPAWTSRAVSPVLEA